MKASVVGWPIILITFGQEAKPELAKGFFPPCPQEQEACPPYLILIMPSVVDFEFVFWAQRL